MTSRIPRVSIVTIFLDEATFIRQAIESVLAQTYQDWELILVDDGSSDASSSIAGDYAAANPEKIRYLEHPGHKNRGTSASRNLALDHARGEFIAILDADDFWFPSKLERQVPLLEAHPEVGMLYGTSLFWHDKSVPDAGSKRDFVHNVGVAPGTVVRPPDLLELLVTNEDTHPPPCSFLIRRSVFTDVGGYDETFADLYEDTVFLAKAYLRFAVLVTGDCSAGYRLHPNSTCHRAVEEGQYHPTLPNAARQKYLEWLDAYLGKEGIVHPRLRAAVHLQLAAYRDRPRSTQLGATSNIGILRQASSLIARARKRLAGA